MKALEQTHIHTRTNKHAQIAERSAAYERSPLRVFETVNIGFERSSLLLLAERRRAG